MTKFGTATGNEGDENDSATHPF